MLMKEMKFWLIFSLLGFFGSLMALTACSDDDNVVPPSITLDTNMLSLSGSGHAVTLTYQVSDAPESTLQPEIQVDAEWVHVTDHSTLGTLTLEVDPAPFAVKVRTATVTLSLPEYPNAQATCTLTQGENEEDFYIDVDEVLSDRAFYSATPQSYLSDYRYLCTCITKEQADTWGDEPRSVMAGLLERQNQWYEGVSWYDPSLSGYTRYANEPVEREVTLNLEPGHEYCVVALAFSGSLSDEKTIQQLEYKSKVVKRYFTTPVTPEEVQPATATIQVNVRGCLADVAVSCSRDDVSVRAVNIEAYRIPTLTTDISDVWTQHRSGYSYDFMTKEKMTKGSFRQENVSSFMRENTEYAYCIRLYDKQLHALTDWMVERYTTTEAQPSDITFPKVEFSYETIFTVKADVTPSNNDPYLATLYLEKYMEGLSEEKLAEYLTKRGWHMTGQSSFQEVWGPNEKMVLLLAGAANYYQELTTPILRIPYQTPAVTFSSDVTASVKWMMRMDGDAYAAEYGKSSCEGKSVLAVWLDRSPAAAKFYNSIFTKGISEYFEQPGFEEDICYSIFRNGYLNTQFPIIYIVPKDFVLQGNYFIGFPADEERHKMGKPFIHMMEDVAISTIEEYKQRLQEESAKTRMETPWNIEPVEAKIQDYSLLRKN